MIIPRIFTPLVLVLFAGSYFHTQAQFKNRLDEPLTSSGFEFNTLESLAISRSNLDLIIPLGPIAQKMREESYLKEAEGLESKRAGFWIKLGSKEFLYKNQRFYEVSASIYKPVKSWELDRNLRKTLRMLRHLERKSPYARNIIRTLQYSENRFTVSLVNCIDSFTLFPLPKGKFGALNNNAYAFQVIERDEIIVDYAPFDKIGSGAEIRWQPKHKMLKLAHELSHAYDANYGLLDDRLIRSDGDIMPAREIRALFHENMIRRELKKEYREEVNSGKAWLAHDMPYTYPLPVPARY